MGCEFHAFYYTHNFPPLYNNGFALRNEAVVVI